MLPVARGLLLAVGRALGVAASVPAAALLLRTFFRVTALLEFVLGDAADDRTANCTKEAMVGLLACISTSEPTGYSTAKAAFTLLGTTGSTFLVT